MFTKQSLSLYIACELPSTYRVAWKGIEHFYEKVLIIIYNKHQVTLMLFLKMGLKDLDTTFLKRRCYPCHLLPLSHSDYFITFLL